MRIEIIVRIVCVFFLSIVILSAQTISADRGMVSIHGISVFEPGQKAIIAWDGNEEILILSTDAYAASNTSVLEILPLPSNPDVELGNFSSFYQIQRLIDYHSYKQDRNYFGPLDSGEANASVEIVFQKKLGAHNITIIHIKSMQNYTDWIESFLAEKNASTDVLPSTLNSIILEYLNQDISYFVFDEISLTPTTWSIAPIIYRFFTDYLYYPLKISSIIEGDTTITLFCITDQDIDWGSAENLGFVRKIEFDLNQTELSEIDPEIGEMFAEGARLYANRYNGPLGTLSKDISLKASARFSDLPIILVAVSISLAIGISVILALLDKKRTPK
jgi:hypothetical protein